MVGKPSKEVIDAISLFLVLFLTWQVIYVVALIFPVLYDYWLFAYLVVLAVAICYFILARQTIGDLGLKKTKIWKTSITIGFVFAVVYNIYWIVLGTPIFSTASVRIVSHGIFSVPYNLLFGLTVGFVEELSFRGYILRNLSKIYSNTKAIAYSSVLFGLYHLSLISAFTSTTPIFDPFAYWILIVLAAILIGIFLGCFYTYTEKTTIGPITYHSFSIFIESLIPFTLATSQLNGHLLSTTVYIFFIPILLLAFKRRQSTQTKSIATDLDAVSGGKAFED